MREVRFTEASVQLWERLDDALPVLLEAAWYRVRFAWWWLRWGRRE